MLLNVPLRFETCAFLLFYNLRTKCLHTLEIFSFGFVSGSGWGGGGQLEWSDFASFFGTTVVVGVVVIHRHSLKSLS